MNRKWSKELLAVEILLLYQSGENLSYSDVARADVGLLRAAVRCFGNWEAAVTFAGIDYSAIRRYKTWTRERIVARIQELHCQGVDLSWRNVSQTVDPQLAAAATNKSHFGSWRDAIEAAGLDYETIRRYRQWDDNRVLNMVRERHAQGAGLNARNIEVEDTALITAARRRFAAWHKALTAAGLDYRSIVLRAPFKRGAGRGQSKNVAATI